MRRLKLLRADGTVYREHESTHDAEWLHEPVVGMDIATIRETFGALDGLPVVTLPYDAARGCRGYTVIFHREVRSEMTVMYRARRVEACDVCVATDQDGGPLLMPDLDVSDAR